MYGTISKVIVDQLSTQPLRAEAALVKQLLLCMHCCVCTVT